MKPYILLGLTAVLAACTGPSAPAGVASVQVSGDTTVVIGQTKTLSATVKSDSGSVLTGQTVTWSSSDPDLVTVDGSGTITARHFSVDAAKKTVTITASAGGKSGTISVLPYGLDVSCGTYTISTDAGADILAYARFRNADGSNIAADTNYALTGPAGFNKGAAYTGRIFQSTSTGAAYGAAPAVSGNYGATISVGGVTYTDACTVDAAQVLGYVTTPALTVTANKATYSGTAPSNTRYVFAFITTDVHQGTPSYATGGAVLTAAAFSLTGDLNPAAPSGTYEGWIHARNYSNTLPMPDVVMMSLTRTGSVTLP